MAASCALTEDDIPGASLQGRSPAMLKNEEFRFSLKCRGDTLKGLKTKAQLVKREDACASTGNSQQFRALLGHDCGNQSFKTMLSSLLFRVEEYIKEGRDQNIVDLDPDSVYSKHKERLDKTKDDNSGICVTQIPLSFPSDGWSADIRRMSFFTCAKVNLHISKSGKRIDLTSKAHSVPTSIRKATTFLNEEYLKNISAASDENYFYSRSHCYHSFRKNDAPHNLKVALCIFSGEVKRASCSGIAGKVGFCNHILALLMKIANSHYMNVKLSMNLKTKKTCSQSRKLY